MADATVESTVDSGSQMEPEGTDAIATEQTELSPPSGDSEKYDGDFWDTSSVKDPKEVSRIKSIQREYNKKSERSSELERKVSELERKTQEYEAAVQATLKDPNLYKKYRKDMGLEKEIDEVEPPKPQKLETVDDLVNYMTERDKWWQKKVDNAIASSRQDLEKRITTVAQPVAEERWNSAISKMRDDYPDFSKVEPQVINQIVSGPYRTLYGQKGISEKDLLDKVFKAEFPDLYANHVLKKRQESTAKKKSAATESPRKTQVTSSKASTADEIIARVNARLGT